MDGISSIFLLVLILSIIFHEIAHGFVAYAFGDPTAKLAGRLTLNPIKHLDPIGSVVVPALLVLTSANILFGWAKPVPYNPYNLKTRFAEGMVAAAGVLLNFFLAFVFAMFLRFGGIANEALIEIFSIIIIVNLFLAFLNFLPFPPLDGARIFINIMPKVIGAKVEAFVQRSQAQLGFFGSMAVVFLFLLLVLGPLSQATFWTYLTLTGSPSTFLTSAI